MIRLLTKWGPWPRFGALCLLAFNLGSQAADVLAYIRPLSTDIAAEVSEPFALLAAENGTQLAWPCDLPIRVAVNLESIPERERAGILEDVLSAMDDISTQSRFRFQFIGLTTAIPSMSWAGTWSAQTPAAQVVVAFGDGRDTDLIRPNAAGMGGYFYADDPQDGLQIIAGYVYVHTKHLADYRPGRGFMSRVALLTHELLHVLGLGHVHPARSESVMTPRLSVSRGDLGPGDRAGLSRLAEISCP